MFQFHAITAFVKLEFTKLFFFYRLETEYYTANKNYNAIYFISSKVFLSYLLISLWNKEYRNTNSIQSSLTICFTFGFPFTTSQTFTGGLFLPISPTVPVDFLLIFIPLVKLELAYLSFLKTKIKPIIPIVTLAKLAKVAT